MLIFEHTETISSYLNSKKHKGCTVAFVPTMGALHEGHLSLVDIANKRADISVSSIFVNPTQFNDAADLKLYPRTLSTDLKMLNERNCDVVFIPSVHEVYPPDLDTAVAVDLDGLDQQMEGAFRPGHFQGMMQVVKRLLDIMTPDFLIMGQKDFQQYRIVEEMIQELAMSVELIMAPISREEDGLARSSRNKRLTPAYRQNAPIIYETLQWIYTNYEHLSIGELCTLAMDRIASNSLQPEYVQIVDTKQLKLLTKKQSNAIACVAAWAGDVRLIDNILLP